MPTQTTPTQIIPIQNFNSGTDSGEQSVALQALTDSELYKRCQEYGLNAKIWMRKFAGLLPEVYRRRLYKRRGYVSIHEFAAKLAGMSERSVDKILNLNERLKNTPLLHYKLISGEAGWSKIEKVASIASPENDHDLSRKVEKLPQQALEIYVREFRKIALKSHQKNKIESTQEGYNASPRERLSIEVDADVLLKLRQFKQKLERESGEAMSFNEVLKAMLENLEAAPKNQSTKQSDSGSVLQLCPDCIQRREQKREKARAVTRSIPSAVRRLVLLRQTNRCAYKNCYHPPTIFHHTRRYALKRSHDPQFIVALCTAHERLAHAGLIKHEEGPPEYWQIREAPDWWDLKNIIDARVMEKRQLTTAVHS